MGRKRKDHNLFMFPGPTGGKDMNPEVIARLAQRHMKELPFDSVIILGRDKETKRLFFSSSYGDIRKILWDFKEAENLLTHCYRPHDFPETYSKDYEDDY